MQCEPPCRRLSAFCYNNIYFLSTVEDPEEKEIDILSLLIFVFDSLYKIMPDKIRVLVYSKFTFSIHMPTLGIDITIPPGCSILSKQGLSIVIEKDGLLDSYKTHSNVVYGNIISLQAKKDNFIHKNILSKLAPYDLLEPENFNLFSIKCKNAIILLLDIEPSFDYQIEKIEYICPMQRVREATKSFTVSGFPHIIFLSDCHEIIKLTENILHESLHDELNIFLNYYQLFSTEEKLYFSPWREDPRPVRGLVSSN